MGALEHQSIHCHSQVKSHGVLCRSRFVDSLVRGSVEGRLGCLQRKQTCMFWPIGPLCASGVGSSEAAIALLHTWLAWQMHLRERISE